MRAKYHVTSCLSKAETIRRLDMQHVRYLITNRIVIWPKQKKRLHQKFKWTENDAKITKNNRKHKRLSRSVQNAHEIDDDFIAVFFLLHLISLALWNSHSHPEYLHSLRHRQGICMICSSESFATNRILRSRKVKPQSLD